MNYIKILIDRITEQGLWEKERTIERNEFLKVSGSTDTNLYHVIDGSFRIFTITEYEENTIRLGYAGNIITALDSFITGNPSLLYIQAIKKSQVRMVTKTNLEKHFFSIPENVQIWNKLLERFVVEQMEREQDILINSPQERYKRVLQRSPHIFQEIPHKYIASYLRMSPETLSRLKKS